MRLKVLMITILFASFFVIGACSSPDTSKENNEQNNNTEENNNTENNEANNQTDNNDEDNTETNNDTEENSSDNKNNDEQNSVDGEMVSTDFEDISFSYPSNAQQLTDLDDIGMPVIAYVIDPETGTNFNIVVESLPFELTLDEYVELVKENNPEINYTKDQKYSANDIEMHEFEGYNDEIPLRQRTFIHKDAAYVISYGSADEASYEEFLPVLDKITESVNLK